MKFATQYDFKSRGTDFAVHNKDASLTQQSDAKDADLNVIMERFTKTGQIPQVIGEALSGDFTNVMDYRGALEAIAAMNEAFAEIPAKIREKFQNDPQKFAEFVQDPNNAKELKEMGLTKPEKIVETLNVNVINDESVFRNDHTKTPLENHKRFMEWQEKQSKQGSPESKSPTS